MTDRTDGPGEAPVPGREAADGPVPWWRAEPGRLHQDRSEIADRFPGLVWDDPPEAIRGAGGWRGPLPLWPFDRLAPPEVARVGTALLVQVVYPQAYPVIAPALYPIEPAPEIGQLTDHRWHLNGDGSLCLLRSADQWSPRDSLVDLLLKAAGWRIEYALLHFGLISAMTESGIVSSPELDVLVRDLPATISGECVDRTRS